MSFLKDFKTNILSSAAIIQIVSHETLRIRANCVRASLDLGRDLYIWNSAEGLKKYNFDNKTLGETGKMAIKNISIALSLRLSYLVVVLFWFSINYIKSGFFES